MARDILSASHPNIAHMRISGMLTHDDMHCDKELGLGTGKPVAVLLDVTAMKLDLPEDFLAGASTSFLINPDLMHLALVIKSPLLRSVALMIGRFTQRKDMMSLHDTTADAEMHLLAILRRKGL